MLKNRLIMTMAMKLFLLLRIRFSHLSLPRLPLLRLCQSIRPVWTIFYKTADWPKLFHGDCWMRYHGNRQILRRRRGRIPSSHLLQMHEQQ